MSTIRITGKYPCLLALGIFELRITSGSQPGRKHREISKIEREFAFRMIHIEVVRYTNIPRRRGENIGKPTALKQPVFASVIQRRISARHHVATAK